MTYFVNSTLILYWMIRLEMANIGFSNTFTTQNEMNTAQMSGATKRIKYGIEKNISSICVLMYHIQIGERFDGSLKQSPGRYAYLKSWDCL